MNLSRADISTEEHPNQGCMPWEERKKFKTQSTMEILKKLKFR